MKYSKIWISHAFSFQNGNYTEKSLLFYIRKPNINNKILRFIKKISWTSNKNRVE
jgi:hypothetical protein